MLFLGMLDFRSVYCGCAHVSVLKGLGMLYPFRTCSRFSFRFRLIFWERNVLVFKRERWLNEYWHNA